MSSVPSTTHAVDTDALHRAHARSVLAYCVYHLRSREEAEDAVQIVFLNAQRSLARGVEPEFQRAWLLKIAERVVSNVQRASRRRAKVEFPVDLAGLADAVAGTGRASSSAARLIEAFARVSEKQRRALILCEIYGLSHAEASVEMGISPNAVGALLTRGRRSLAAELSRSGTGPRVRISRCLPVLFDLKWLVGSVGAKIAAGGASLAVVGLVSHPGQMPGRATTSPGDVHVAFSAVASETSGVRVRPLVPGRPPAHAHVVRAPRSPAAPSTAASPAGDEAAPDAAPVPVDTVAPAAHPQAPVEPPGADPQPPGEPPAAPSPSDPAADVPVLQVDGPPAAVDDSVVSDDALSERGPAGRGAGRSSAPGVRARLGPCDDPPCAPARAAHSDVARGAPDNPAQQEASDEQPLPPAAP